MSENCKDEEKARIYINIFDFELSSEEIQIIDSFNINARIRYDPDNCDFTIL
jgi:methylglyoxal/glyoxal reductase